MIDSGSRDRSVEIARAAGAELIEIDPGEFSHGRTRNLGAERTAGELICFLTQDATPCPGWLAAYLEAFTLDERTGVAYGPHLPRPDTSPMIARELVEFFAGFSPDGAPVVQRAGDATFLSNVNACYARGCWEEIRFRDVPYAEDQAFGEDVLAAGFSKVYHPGAAVLHAHDYPPVEFMRRYFDEYRGLREATGHVEPFALGGSAGHVRRAVGADRRWMIERGMSSSEVTRWTARATVHHAGRKVFSALGSRAEKLPGPVRGGLSLERRDDGRGGGVDGGAPEAGGAASQDVAPSLPPTSPVPRKLSHEVYDVAARVWANGPAPLLEPSPGGSERERLRLAMVIPPFSRGSGGHNTLFQIFTRLEQRGHTCSVWLADYYGYRKAGLARRAAPGDPRVLRAVRRPGLQGLRALAGRRRRDRDRLGHGARDARARRLPRARLRRQRPRAGVLRGLGRVRAERRHVHLRHALHRGQPLAARSADRPLRAPRRRPSSSESTTTSTGRGRSSAAATR